MNQSHKKSQCLVNVEGSIYHRIYNNAVHFGGKMSQLKKGILILESANFCLWNWEFESVCLGNREYSSRNPESY